MLRDEVERGPLLQRRVDAREEHGELLGRCAAALQHRLNIDGRHAGRASQSTQQRVVMLRTLLQHEGLRRNLGL